MGAETIIPMMMMARNCPVTNPDAITKMALWLKIGMGGFIAGTIIMVAYVFITQFGAVNLPNYIFIIGNFIMLIGAGAGACMGFKYWLESMK
jgi:hypothetical protein